MNQGAGRLAPDCISKPHSFDVFVSKLGFSRDFNIIPHGGAIHHPRTVQKYEGSDTMSVHAVQHLTAAQVLVAGYLRLKVRA